MSNTTNSAVTVRRAAPGDFLHVAVLLAELGRPHVIPETADAAQAVYERHIAAPDTASMVAEVNGEVIGFLSLIFRDRLNCVHSQAWIPDLIVTETARGQGAAKALLNAAFEASQKFGCDRVTLESGYTRTVAHKVYEGIGMSNDGYFFQRAL